MIDQSSLKRFIINSNSYLFRQNKESKNALAYLVDDRKLNIDTINKFKIGYFPANYEIPEPIRYLNTYGAEDPNDYSYSIKNKIIVPILNDTGCPLGFATRTPSADNYGKIKWWNTPFKKSECLYGLFNSKRHIFKLNKVYIVEGQIDMIMLYQSKIKNVVAIMGTAFSEYHMGLILRYCDNICFGLDADSAGFNSLALSLKKIRDIKDIVKFSKISYMSFPDGLDPDEYVSINGKDSFYELEKELNDDKIDEIIFNYEESKKQNILRKKQLLE